MNKWSALKVIAVLVAGLLLSHPTYAEYGGSYGGGSSISSSDAGSILGPVSSSLSGAGKSGSPDSFADSTQKAAFDQLDENLKIFSGSQKELQNRQRNAGGREETDRLSKIDSGMDLALAQINKNDSDKTKRQQSLAQTLQSVQNFSPLDLNTKNLDATCKSGVNFEALPALVNDLGKPAFEFLRTNVSKLLKNKDEENKKQLLKDMATLYENFKKSSQEQEEAEAQDNILDGKGLADKINQGEFALNKRLKQEDAVWNIEKATIKQKRLDLFDKLFTKVVPALSKRNQDSADVAELAHQVSASCENYRQAAYNQAIQMAQQLKVNCDNAKQKVGGGLAPGLINDIYQEVLRKKYDPNDANAFLQKAGNGSTAVCTDSAPELDALLGANLQTACSTIGQATTYETLIGSALTGLSTVGNAQSQVGTGLNKPMAACAQAAFDVKSFQKKLDEVKGLPTQDGGQGQQQASAQQSQRQPTQRRGRPQSQGSTRGFQQQIH